LRRIRNGLFASKVNDKFKELHDALTSHRSDLQFALDVINRRRQEFIHQDLSEKISTMQAELVATRMREERALAEKIIRERAAAAEASQLAISEDNAKVVKQVCELVSVYKATDDIPTGSVDAVMSELMKDPGNKRILDNVCEMMDDLHGPENYGSDTSTSMTSASASLASVSESSSTMSLDEKRKARDKKMQDFLDHLTIKFEDLRDDQNR
jgi:hypothetical protein